MGQKEAQRISSIITHLCPTDSISQPVNKKRLERHLETIKDIRDGDLRVVIPYRSIGIAKVIRGVDPDELFDCLQAAMYGRKNG